MQKTYFGQLTQLSHIHLFIDKLLALYAAILNHMPSATTLKYTLENLNTALKNKYSPHGQGCKLLLAANTVLLHFTGQTMIGGNEPDLPKLHIGFFEELLGEFMLVFNNVQKLVVMSTFRGDKESQIEYLFGMSEGGYCDYWALTISETQGMKNTSELPSFENYLNRQLKLLSILELDLENVTFITRIVEFCVLLCIYLVYNGYKDFQFSQDKFQLLKTYFEKASQAVKLPVCMSKLFRLVKKFMVRSDPKQKLKLEGDKIARDARSCISFFLTKFNKYTSLINFFLGHTPCLHKARDTGRLEFKLVMTCSYPLQTETWRVVMSNEGQELEIQFDINDQSEYSECWKSVETLEEKLKLVENLAECYEQRIEHGTLTSNNLRVFENCLKWILLSLIWQMSAAQKQAEVDRLVKTFKSIIDLFNRLIVSYGETSMQGDGFKLQVEKATNFYLSSLIPKPIAAQYHVKWTNMAEELCDNVTLNEGQSVSTMRDYMTKKGLVIQLHDFVKNPKLSDMFTLRNESEFYNVQCKTDEKTNLLSHAPCAQVLKIKTLLEAQVKNLDSKQILTTLILCKVYKSAYFVTLLPQLLERLASFGAVWHRVGKGLFPTTSSDESLMHYESLKEISDKFNLTLCMVADITVGYSKKFLEVNQVESGEALTESILSSAHQEVAKEEESVEVKEERQPENAENVKSNEDEDKEEKKVQPNEHGDWTKNEMVRFTNVPFWEHGTGKISLWEVDVRYKNGLKRVFTFTRLQDFVWNVMATMHKGGVAPVNWRNLQILFDEIADYGKVAKSLDLDSLQELLFLTTLVN
ncbi:hypothetical protein Ciccas_013423, partial [Cichlidogyrus casuarinus]